MAELSAQQVAARLGVKLDTVYAYVSRGVLSVRQDASSRRSRFDADEVETLARRGRPRRTTRPSALDLIVETDLTTVVEQRMRYRSRDAGRLARTVTFEQAAEWLWSGVEGPGRLPWESYPVDLPDLSDVRDRIRAAVILASAREPLRADLSPAAVTTSARRLIATMVSAVPAGPESRAARLLLPNTNLAIRGTLAGRLWSQLATGRAVPELVATLNAALVLLADHELASSTMAARIAASVRADPFSVVLAGLGALAGPLHGSASAATHRMLADATERGPEPALAAALEAHQQLPGFGHPLYPDGDPRARLLLEMLDVAAPAAAGRRTARALVEAARRHSRTEPNVDFALGVLSTVARMPASAGETIFTVARTAGWLAHAIEEYAEPPLRFRARAVRRPERVQTPARTA